MILTTVKVGHSFEHFVGLLSMLTVDKCECIGENRLAVRVGQVESISLQISDCFVHVWCKFERVQPNLRNKEEKIRVV